MKMRKTAFAFWVGLVFYVSSIGAEAYVMPPEQLIDYMQDKFSVFNTVILSQKTVVLDPQDGKETNVFEEKIWVKTPGYFKSQVIAGLRNGPKEEPFDPGAFRQLLMGNNKHYILMLLAKFGIDVNSSGYTRCDGVVAYFIGSGEPGSARLLLNKETFFPMLLEYEAPGVSEPVRVSIRFEAYREISNGWYPFTITCQAGEKVLERYTVLDLQANMPLSSALFERNRAAEKPQEKAASIEEEHLQEAIRALKDKYR